MDTLVVRDTQGRQISHDGTFITPYKDLSHNDRDDLNSFIIRLIGYIPIVEQINIDIIKNYIKNILPIIPEDHPNFEAVINVYRIFVAKITKNELSESDLLRIVDVIKYVQDLIVNDNNLTDNYNNLINIQKTQKTDLILRAYILVIGERSLTKILDDYFI